MKKCHPIQIYYALVCILYVVAYFEWRDDVISKIRTQLPILFYLLIVDFLVYIVELFLVAK